MEQDNKQSSNSSIMIKDPKAKQVNNTIGIGRASKSSIMSQGSCSPAVVYGYEVNTKPEIYQPTMEIKFIWIKKRDIAPVGSIVLGTSYTTHKILHQKWIGNKGGEEWKEVPTDKEEN